MACCDGIPCWLNVDALCLRMTGPDLPLSFRPAAQLHHLVVRPLASIASRLFVTTEWEAYGDVLAARQPLKWLLCCILTY